MRSRNKDGLCLATGLVGAALLFFAGALEADELKACPRPALDAAEIHGGSEPAVRRLRTTVAAGVDSSGADLAELAFVTSSSPNPRIQKMLQVPGDQGTRLKLTVVNNSRHGSPDGGITLSFPELTSPSDRARLEQVDVPDGMALHVIPAGGEVFARKGRTQVARHLMVEVHGSWQPRQVRTLELDLIGTTAPVVVHYRSALADASGVYHNTPAESDALDQQGWPSYVCLVGGRGFVGVDRGRTTAQTGGSDH